MNRMKSLCSDKSSVSTMETIDSEVGDIVGQASCGLHVFVIFDKSPMPEGL